jgi:23S rRNA pseudouridine1911/1915/1917 synthase
MSSAQPDRHARLVVDANESGRRLDMFVVARLPALSRAEAQRLIRSGHVRLGGARTKPGALVRAGAAVEVELPLPAPLTLDAEPLALAILHDDEDIVVVDKPAGLVVHPGAGHRAGTLVNALLHHVKGLSGIGGAERPGIVHRLDRGTSGVMVIAKHDRAHRDLARQFHDRLVGKEYVALVWGTARAGQTFDKPIGRDPKHRQRMSTRASRARAATTQVVDAEPLGGATLVRVRIGTGRTHQIRVHLSDAGHPVVGDAVSGGARRPPPRLAPVARLTRPFLHAARLSFAHPATGETMTFESPLPADVAGVLEAIRRERRA